MRRLCLLLLLSTVNFAVCVRHEMCLAAGLDHAVVGPRASAMGTAFTGLADDPSAIYYNPAGVALLNRKQGLSTTVRYDTVELKYEFPEGRTSPAGKDRGTTDLMGIFPEIFYYRQFPSKYGTFSAGIGIYVPYGGLAGSWDKDTFGVDMDQLMAVASITPSFSWAITPKLAVGAGMNVYFSFIRSKLTFDRIPLGLFAPDIAAALPKFPGEPQDDPLRYLPLKLKQDSYAYGFSFGYNVGAMYKPFDWLSLGLAVRSGSRVSMDGPADIVLYLNDPLSVYLETDYKVEFTLPYMVIGGIAVRPIDNLVLVGDVQYHGWGRMDEIKITFERFNYTQIIKTGYADTVKFNVGMEYSFKQHYSARLGYIYTPSNIKHKEYLSYQNWDMDVQSISFGLGYTWTNFSVHFLGMITLGEPNEKNFDDPGDPIGKPAGKYTAFHQTYGAGFLWYF